MADVQLPSINQGETDIKKMVSQLLNAYIVLTEELTYLLNNLDTRNVNELNAEVIIAGSIQTDKLAAGSVTADKIEVNELSAISADLGTITAGLINSIQIFGSYIATRNGTFPRSEMSNTEDLFAAYRDASNFVKVQPSIAGAPAIRFTSSDVVIGSLNSTYGYLEIWAPVILALTASKVQFGSWYNLYNDDKGTTLGDELDNIWEAINSKSDIRPFT